MKLELIYQYGAITDDIQIAQSAPSDICIRG